MCLYLTPVPHRRAFFLCTDRRVPKKIVETKTNVCWVGSTGDLLGMSVITKFYNRPLYSLDAYLAGSGGARRPCLPLWEGDQVPGGTSHVVRTLEIQWGGSGFPFGQSDGFRNPSFLRSGYQSVSVQRMDPSLPSWSLDSLAKYTPVRPCIN